MGKKSLMQFYGGKMHLINDIINIVKPFYKDKKIASFVDVFGGSGKVLLNIPEAWRVNRIYNDIDKRLYTLLNVLRNDNKRELLFERIRYTLSSRELFYEIKNENPENDIDIAFNFLYLLFCSVNGDMKSYGILVNNYRSMNYQRENLYNNYKYIKDWRIENLDFRDLIPKYDGEKTLFYLDPPYLTGGKRYKYSFSINDFKDLKNILDNIKGYWVMNENEIDFKKIKEIFGEPKFVKTYKNCVNKNRNSKNKTLFRLEGYWTNFDVKKEKVLSMYA